MIKNIIFDFDGVIVDSEVLVGRAFSKYLKNLGHNFEEKYFFQFAGQKTIESVSYLSSKLSIKNQEKFYNDILEISAEIFSKDLETVNGAYDYITNSKKNVFIGSNSMKSRINIGLKKVGLDKYFHQDSIISFEMVKKPKPYPDIYLKVIEMHNLNKEETIVIEDSSVGVTAAKKAGIKVIALTAGSHWHQERSKKDLIVSDPFKIIQDYKLLDNIILNL